MNPSTLKALDRLTRRLERAERRRPRRFSTAPLVLGLGLTLGYQLLVRLVPRVWGAMLPGGWDQANNLRGWPGLVWALALAAHHHFTLVIVLIAGSTLLAWGAIRAVPAVRFLVWLAALAVILFDAGILYVTLRTTLEVVGQGVIFD